MTALFWDFFEVTISASIVIGVILLLRLFSRRVPKSIVCVLWAILFVRLLLPIQIESPVSVQTNAAGEIRQEVQQVAQQQFVGSVSTSHQTAEQAVWVPAVNVGAIVSAVWMVGVAGMLMYMLISYIRLRRCLTNAVIKEKNVFIVPGLETAFLFGYFSPSIYLPDGLRDDETELVIAHEQAHLKRGDNCLKLLGFVALAVHWYNPLVWLTYTLLCRDIETACDEYVVRYMQEHERKRYASALLSCDSHKNRLLRNPVSFAEDNVKKRIFHILEYRKPAFWICMAAVIAVLLVSIFILPNTIAPEHPQYYEELISMLGQPIDDVCAKLGISESDLITVEKDFFQTPLNVNYAGVEFKLSLIKRIDADILGGFQYYTEYNGNGEIAAKDTAAVSHKLYNSFGNGEVGSSLAELTVESIDTMFNTTGKGSGQIYCLWDLTDSGDGNIKRYLEGLKDSRVWKNMYKESKWVPAYQREFLAYKKHPEETVVIGIIYHTYASNDKVFATDVEPQSWWEKLFD